LAIEKKKWKKIPGTNKAIVGKPVEATGCSGEGIFL
jgi:hypothetical protein